MIRRVALLLIALVAAGPAGAEPARVSSGDHPDFTRIVIQYAAPVNWSIGRTPDGYELRLADTAAQYDLSRVFDQIGKDRLAAIWSDPDSGALHFGIGCACFVMPFEFRPGTIVVDIRKGAPPKGSSFEIPLDGGKAAELTPRPVIRPKKRPASNEPAPEPAPEAPQLAYDWTALRSPSPQEPAGGGFAQALSAEHTVDLDLEPLRQSLVEQLSRGATQGIVEMAKPKVTESMPETEANPSVEIRLGDAPNLVVRQKGESISPLTAEGLQCIEDEKLNLADWAEDTPISEQIGPVRADLIGEFDIPNPEAVERAVKFDLSIGFGAEARALMRAFPTTQEDAAIWQSLARILDGEPDPDPVFAGMAACDTSAALWSVLADPETLAVGQVEKAAILRGFSSLPNHLRRQLGPTLVERFLTMQDLGTAIALRDAVLRGTAEPGPEVELMQAAIDRAGGFPSASEQRLEAVAAESGPNTTDALAALVIQRAELGQDVSFDQVQTLEEYTKERVGSEGEKKFNLALTLAYAASGDFQQSFDRLAADPEAAPTFWQILGVAGPDSALISLSTLDRGQKPPVAAKKAASLIATRMLKLGLADQAARWLDLVEAPPPLLAARVELANGRPQQALDLVTADDQPAAFPVRVEALRALGDEMAVAALFAEAGMTEEHWQTVSRMRDWESLAASGPEVWKTAAQKLIGPTAADPAPDAQATADQVIGPLARSEALIADSAGTRDAITALLGSVKSPAPLTQ